MPEKEQAVKDPIILYYETPEFVAYLAAYELALEAEAERILLFRSHGLQPVARTTNPACVAASSKQAELWHEAQRLLAICRATPEHKAAFNY